MAAAKKIMKVANPLSWHYCGYIKDGNTYIYIYEDGQGHYMNIRSNSSSPPALGPA
jgi:hypothetical protein